MTNQININITKEAISKAKELIEANTNSIGLRIEIQKGGC